MSKQSDDECTPESCWRPVLNALEIRRFAIDPCSHPDATLPASTRYFGPARGHVDGLTHPWGVHVAWCNPPYSNPAPWVRRCADHAGAVMLISGDTSTKVWRDVIWPRALAVVFYYGRIKFISPHQPDRKAGLKRNNALVIFGDIVKNWAPLEAVGKIIVP